VELALLVILLMCSDHERLRVIVRCTHLEGLKFINHLFAHLDNVFKSLCNIVMSSVVLMIQYIKVSSAYNFTWNETVEGRSLIYNKNKRGPRTEPWGIPICAVQLEKVTTVPLWFLPRTVKRVIA